METLTKLTCSRCDAEIPEDESFQYDSEDYCEDCYNELFTTCDDCSETIPSEDAHYCNDETLCDDCFDNNYFNCESCNEVHHLDDSYSAFDRLYCGDCFHESYTYCQSCDEPVSRDETYFICDLEIDVCDYCAENNYQYCDECGQYYEDECECGSNGSNPIRNHTYKPEPKFHGKGKLHFGFELEIESYNGNDLNDTAKYITDKLDGLIYCKNDGSLNNGFEIVSHPFTFDFLKNNLLKKNKLNPIFDLRIQGFRSYNTSTCGIHVHLSRKAFTDLHLYKFMKFFYENPRFIWKFSQRKLENLNRWSTLTGDKQPIIQKVKEKYNPSRYVAVNMNNNHTVEIRIFRGTLKKEGFLRNIEFCHAIFEYTKDASIKNAHNIDGFYAFVKANKSKYINLYDSITRRDLLS